jgi:coenzyme F420-reducing hydrogenase gamma subunit
MNDSSEHSGHAARLPAPTLAVFKFASCDGCQLQILSCEDELLTIADRVRILYFLEASSHFEPGPYDVALVEGSITTPADRDRIRRVREQSRFLIAIGACATSGGIQSLKNWGDHHEFLRSVYAEPAYIRTLSTSTAISDHVAVDFELRGCPINKLQLVEVIQSLLRGQSPRTPRHSVCVDCKRRGTVCVAVAQGKVCLGPVTQSGCGAICPEFSRGCYGCFGPAGQPNCESLSEHWIESGRSPATLVPLLRNFNADAPAFREEGDRIDPNYDQGHLL